MNWFEGQIIQAIGAAKEQNKLFIVVVTGNNEDEASNQFLSLLNEVSGELENTICIKVENGSVSCKQFSAIYPVILVPSIYFIDSQSGVNIETTGGAVTKEKLLESLNKARNSKSESMTSPRNERVEQARQVLQSEGLDDSKSEVAAAATSTPTTSMTLEERVERAKRLLAQKQAEKVLEEKEKDKNSETERREVGKKMAEIKRKQADEEIRKAAEERQKEKEEQRVALEKIREQLAQDRAERAEKFHKEKIERDEKRKELEKQKLAEETRKAEERVAERNTIARIQFRLANGVTQNHKFSPEQTIGDLYQYVIDEVDQPYGSNVSLSTTFPSRQLDQEPSDKSLRDAGLVPSTTILVLPKSRSSSSLTPANGGIMDYVWLLLTPLTVVWGLISSFIFGQGQPPSVGNQGRKRQANEASTSGARYVLLCNGVR